MKIIRPGTNFDRKPSPVRFTCRACGCVFEMDWEELKGWPSRFDRNTQYARYARYARYAECPNCKAWAEETVLR